MDEPWQRGAVLVTGGTGAIGLAIAREFLIRGATVAVSCSSESGAVRAREALYLYGDKAQAFIVDLDPANAAGLLLDVVQKAIGNISVLINCAGLSFNKSINDTSIVEYDNVMNLNLRAVFFASQVVSRQMIERKICGRIINITSGNYRYARPNAAVYAASKAALEMLTRSFSLEMGPHGITVNAVAPGLVYQDSSINSEFRGVADYYSINSPLGRIVQPQEVASAVAFLASEQAAAITGETIVVDNGFSAGRFDFPRRTTQH